MGGNVKPGDVIPAPFGRNWQTATVVAVGGTYVKVKFSSGVRYFEVGELIPPAAKPKPSPKVYSPMTDDEVRAVMALRAVIFPVGSPDKRFARDVQHLDEVTESQSHYLWRLVWRYRRQIKDKGLVEMAKARSE